MSDVKLEEPQELCPVSVHVSGNKLCRSVLRMGQESWPCVLHCGTQFCDSLHFLSKANRNYTVQIH